MPTPTVSRNAVKLLLSLNPTDRLLVAFWCFLSLLSLAAHSRIHAWRFIVLANLAAIILLCTLAHRAQSRKSRVLRWMHDWAAFPLVVFTYKQIYFMVSPIHSGRDYDALLIAMDRALFRIDPTVWLARFSTPYLTEILQIAYSLFYVFFIAVGMELYARKDLFQYQSFRFTVVYGFLLSYIGYFFLPAVGPRFTLHDFSNMDRELPGLLLTPALRWFVNICESIRPGVSSRVALVSAQRDVFPSGHTMMTLIAVALAFRYKLKIRYWTLGTGILLILAAVYLRYHYAIDVLAGALLTLPCLATSRRMRSLMRGERLKESLVDSA